MTIPASKSGEDNYAQELLPPMAAVASVYGDDGGKYATWMKGVEPAYQAEAWYLWDQPLAPGDLAVANPYVNQDGSSSSTNSTSKTNSKSDQNGVAEKSSVSTMLLLGLGSMVTAALTVFA
jgi:hypothetical protein